MGGGTTDSSSTIDSSSQQQQQQPPASLAEPKGSLSQPSPRHHGSASSASASASTVIHVEEGNEMMGVQPLPLPLPPPPLPLPKPPAAQGPCACEGCGVSTPYRCMQCGEAFYCTRAHQREDWAARHHKACAPRRWLPPASVPPLPPPQEHPEPHLPPRDGAALWSPAGGEAGAGDETTAGNAAKRSKVLLDGEAEGGNPQAIWRNPQPSALLLGAPATPRALATVSDWYQGAGHGSGSDNGSGGNGSGSAGGGGATTEPFGPATSLGRTLEEGSGSAAVALPPISPMAGFDGPGLPPPIHPAGYDGDPGAGAGAGFTGMASGDLLFHHRQEEDDQGKVLQLVEMGFDEAEARTALMLRHGDVERACDYILSGVGGGAGGGGDTDPAVMNATLALTSLSGGGGGGVHGPAPSTPATDWDGGDNSQASTTAAPLQQP